MAEHFSDNNFKEQVMEAKGPVMVDFFAEWCGPCKMMGPIIEKLAEEYKGKVKIGKLDIDANPTISEVMGIQSIPTLIFFKDGKIVDQSIGFRSEEDLRKKLEAVK